MDNDRQDQIHQALNRAYFYLKFRPRSEKEVRDYLYKKSEKFHWPQEVVEAALTSLKENEYVNDDNFVAWFVEQRSSGKPKSAFALSYELQRFGVSKDIVKKYFEENPVDESELALNALRRKWPRLQHLDKHERFKKAASFLSRRGFSFEKIKASIQRMEEA